MIVVADTSPICYLIIIEQIDLLPQLFGKVMIPKAVYQELQATGTPEKVQKWITNIPEWLEVAAVNIPDDNMLVNLHQREKEAILLAERIQANLIIIDEKAARQIAQSRGLKITGLLGILNLAANQNLIDLKTTITALQKTNFRASSHLLQSMFNQS
ncbi:DUF3368 domain-containing protein [Sphaerospermopsis kisseleviana CS-549]|uniref:DUF3368 domain-containing protein n=1 Tax=Sphaerospermopsis kisseleviana CS-549 TaxID=3021783 RepID=A0ABT4ZU59_9CYAN|nr:DUF3368 domain-containing protein [Sphaerospermopsis kisseleviana]MDB9442804.1 DUF3368 domain-containing protein [Sphaerospermopsis kisseleviana CS-549]BAZ83090.1 hypothetical protein NIES73_43730 [Sphaerospermopsis kisseleviana NIES-73]